MRGPHPLIQMTRSTEAPNYRWILPDELFCDGGIALPGGVKTHLHYRSDCADRDVHITLAWVSPDPPHPRLSPRWITHPETRREPPCNAQGPSPVSTRHLLVAQMSTTTVVTALPCLAELWVREV